MPCHAILLHRVVIAHSPYPHSSTHLLSRVFCTASLGRDARRKARHIQLRTSYSYNEYISALAKA